MRLYQIEYFLAACKRGSISRAADQLLLSRPAVSRALRELEEEFGVNLFIRASTGISLTEAGQEFYNFCTKIMDQINQLESRMAAIRHGNITDSQRTLRIALSAAGSNYFTNGYYDRFTSEHPDIVLELYELLGGQGSTMLRENTVDLTIAAYFVPENEDEDMDLGSMFVEQMDLVFCCNRNHRFSDRKSIDLPELDGVPLVQLDKSLLKGEAISNLFARHGVSPNIKIRAQQISSLWNLVKNGLGTVTFRQMVEISSDLLMIPFTEPVTYPMQIMWNPNVPHNSAFRDFFVFVDSLMKTKGDPAHS